MILKCIGKTRTNNLCNKICTDKYCDNHKYLEDYTQDMLNNLTLCSGCRKWKYIETSGNCQNCKERIKNVKIKYKEKDEENIILCKYYDKEKDKACEFKQNSELKNGYCGKHQVYYWKQEAEKDGDKVCANFIRGCRNILEDEEFTRCLNCRENERDKEKMRNHEKTANLTKINKKILVKSKKERSINDILICTNCKMSFNLNYFLKDGENLESDLYKQCAKCREKDHLREQKEERKQYRKEYDKSEKRVEYKKSWKSLNKTKLVQYCTDYRNKKIEEIGIEEYRKKCAENAKIWRKEHDGLINDFYKNKKLDSTNKYYYYKQAALLKGLNFDLSEEECNELFNEKCFYCGEQSDNLNIGIDRIDCNCDIGYNLDNVVPCCAVCNMIKNTIPHDIFLTKIVHILSYNKLINIDDHLLNYQMFQFAKSKNSNYSLYKSSAKKRDIIFNLSKDEYFEIIQNNCYICGSKPSDTFICGIDRVDSDKEYSTDNCRACCKDCNYMKNNYKLDYFLNKLKEIYNNLKPLIIENYNIIEKSPKINDQYTVKLNPNKLAKETKDIIRDYDTKVKDNIFLLTNSDKELVKLKVEEYSKNIDNRKNPKVKEYIETIIKPKAVEQANNYFKDNNIENPLISFKDDINTIREFDKKVKNKEYQNTFIGKMTDDKRKEYERLRKQKYRNTPEKPVFKKGSTEEERREYNRKRIQEYRLKKKMENNPE